MSDEDRKKGKSRGEKAEKKGPQRPPKTDGPRPEDKKEVT